jgi:hypothetical protein
VCVAFQSRRRSQPGGGSSASSVPISKLSRTTSLASFLTLTLVGCSLSNFCTSLIQEAGFRWQRVCRSGSDLSGFAQTASRRANRKPGRSPDAVFHNRRRRGRFRSIPFPKIGAASSKPNVIAVACWSRSIPRELELVVDLHHVVTIKTKPPTGT